MALSAEARAALKTYLQMRPKVAGDLLFLSRTHRALDSRDVQRMVSEAARRAGIKYTVTPHTLRHSFATRFLAKNQGDIATLATILEHANISTTTRYLHPNAQRVQAMVEEVQRCRAPSAGHEWSRTRQWVRLVEGMTSG